MYESQNMPQVSIPEQLYVFLYILHLLKGESEKMVKCMNFCFHQHVAKKIHNTMYRVDKNELEVIF
jgi:hypothetical protein